MKSVKFNALKISTMLHNEQGYYYQNIIMMQNLCGPQANLVILKLMDYKVFRLFNLLKVNGRYSFIKNE